MEAEEITALEQALAHCFGQPRLLERALTHSSHANEAEARLAPDPEGPRAVGDNEQMEFLGDAVLGFVTSRTLFDRFPDHQEGELSKMRAHLVSARHLLEVANRLQLGRYLRLGRGEEKSGGRSKSALLVNALEAVIAALYLDAGLEKATEFIRRWVLEEELEQMEAASGGVPITDYKSALQEYLQSRGRQQPNYVLVKEEGPEHQKTFTVEARISIPGGNGKEECLGRAQGSTKKKAEQFAARQALTRLQESPERATQPPLQPAPQKA